MVHWGKAAIVLHRSSSKRGISAIEIEEQPFYRLAGQGKGVEKHMNQIKVSKMQMLGEFGMHYYVIAIIILKLLSS